MVEYNIEQDIGRYQPKFIGPLTFRQTVCLSLGIPVCWAMYRHLTPYLSRDLTGFLVSVPAFLCAAIGWCRPYGMKTEQYLKALVFCRFLYPRRLNYIMAATQGTQNPRKTKRTYKVSPEAVR